MLKALKEIGFEQYYQAEQTGWVLYLEGSTDLAILRAFAETLGHEAVRYLERPFIHYVLNQPQKAREHFYGLREAKQDLVGVALFDHLGQSLHADAPLRELMWQRREIENYLCYPDVLLAYARAGQAQDLFTYAEAQKREQVMQECIRDLVPPVALRNLDDRWWIDTKSSDDFLDRLFEMYFERLGLPNLMRKTDYHQLAQLVPKEQIVEEVLEKLDTIVAVAESAQGLEDSS